VKFIEKFKQEARLLPNRLRKEIWQYSSIGDSSWRGRYFSFLRFFYIAYRGFMDNNILQRAASLSYSSLLALGPMVIIAIMVSSLFLQGEDGEVSENDAITDLLSKAIYFVAPQTMSIAEEEGTTSAGATNETDIQINPELLNFIDGIVDKAQSGGVGSTISLIVLIFISIQLIIAIETTFNAIWGVRRGRAFVQRIVLYWTLISLGALLGFSSVFLLTASTLKGMFDSLPFGIGEDLFQFSVYLAPIISFTLIVAMLALFYRFIPNCYVRWMPAVVGGILVAALLVGNNYLSFLYINRMVRAQSLYGSVSIVPLLMFGIYIFWVFTLLGGQITYAVQNVNLLANQRAWSGTSQHTRKMLALAAFLMIARRFMACEKPYSQDDLSKTLQVPSNVLNQSLSQLVDLGYINTISIDTDEEEDAVHYQPGKPLDKMTLAAFKESLEKDGNDQGGEILQDADPILPLFNERFAQYEDKEFAETSIQKLLETYPAKG